MALGTFNVGVAVTVILKDTGVLEHEPLLPVTVYTVVESGDRF